MQIINTAEDDKMMRTIFGQSYGRIIAYIIALFVIFPLIVFALHYINKKRKLRKELQEGSQGQSQQAQELQQNGSSGRVPSPGASGRYISTAEKRRDMRQLPQQDDEGQDNYNDDEEEGQGGNSDAQRERARARHLKLDDKLQSEEENELGYQNKDAEYEIVDDNAVNESVDEIRREAFED
jgi:hypothetical protein